jgi:hypothetical protein
VLEFTVIQADLVRATLACSIKQPKISLGSEYGLPRSSVQRAVAFQVQSPVREAFYDGVVLNVGGDLEAAARDSG